MHPASIGVREQDSEIVEEKLMMATSTQGALAAIFNVSMQAGAGARGISRAQALPTSGTWRPGGVATSSNYLV